MIAFVNSFLSYLVLMVILIAIGVCGAVVGTELRKSKNEKEAAGTADQKTAK